MANKYLDGTGLTYFWNKVKKYITSYVSTAVSSKADKVTSATNGNFAVLDSNGNLTDSGHKHSDYLTSESDPVFTASTAYGITSSDVTNWDGKTKVKFRTWNTT